MFQEQQHVVVEGTAGTLGGEAVLQVVGVAVVDDAEPRNSIGAALIRAPPRVRVGISGTCVFQRSRCRDGCRAETGVGEHLRYNTLGVQNHFLRHLAAEPADHEIGHHQPGRRCSAEPSALAKSVNRTGFGAHRLTGPVILLSVRLFSRTSRSPPPSGSVIHEKY